MFPFLHTRTHAHMHGALNSGMRPRTQNGASVAVLTVGTPSWLPVRRPEMRCPHPWCSQCPRTCKRVAKLSERNRLWSLCNLHHMQYFFTVKRQKTIRAKVANLSSVSLLLSFFFCFFSSCFSLIFCAFQPHSTASISTYRMDPESSPRSGSSGYLSIRIRGSSPPPSSPVETRASFLLQVYFRKVINCHPLRRRSFEWSSEGGVQTWLHVRRQPLVNERVIELVLVPEPNLPIWAEVADLEGDGRLQKINKPSRLMTLALMLCCHTDS